MLRFDIDRFRSRHHRPGVLKLEISQILTWAKNCPQTRAQGGRAIQGKLEFMICFVAVSTICPVVLYGIIYFIQGEIRYS